ncbi:tRNA-dihydrouridine synthase [Candidatus Nitronereus thalassa]|uniref:tRNA-dihydrouridine synthase n=1 Tax=Candidatus Nitronereus thalassa TaxID=3020898 RepID=A0ABU3K9K3_9BACT|nr:tRNA-dihydrouridine synthase [Candidatus Nitronereus thalassa]MDT7043099.1 tRNA-dihydrouridine synthase [Candidatus Nitronereus thalassa]
MDGVTDVTFRHVMATYGRPDVLFTEFTNVHDICHGSRAGWEPLRYSECERPIVAQLYGKHPALFYKAAHVIGELGFDGLDINMGCPSKNVASSGSGAGLIRTPDLALEIMASTKQGLADWAQGQTLEEIGLKKSAIHQAKERNQVRWGGSEPPPRRRLPLTVKTRLGYDSVVINEWSDCLAQGQPEVISIHGRTLQQMYRGEADWEAIANATQVIHRHGILVLGNGDIRSLNEAANRIHTSGVDGILIGRAAQGNPWIFQGKDLIRNATQNLNSGPLIQPRISLESRFQMMINHAVLFESFNETPRFPRMRKHLGWYCSEFPYAAAMRANMVKTNTAQEVQRLLDEYTSQHVLTEQEALSASY